MDSKTDDFHRFFLAPGMGHCRRGPDSFGQDFSGDAPVVDAEHDMLSAIVRWVEEGVAPDKIIASKVRDEKTIRTRPLCPHPKQAIYLGDGDANNAQNFECRLPQ